MRQLAFLFIIPILTMQSCVDHKSQNDPFADVPTVIDIDSIKMDSLKLSHLQYIPLETTKECLIGNVNKVLIRNNKIYVADFNTAMALFVFDMNGKFLFKIARTGNGPGEYISFRDFDLQSNGDIYMFDHFGRKFLVFNSSGEYLRDIKTDYYLSSFCLVEDNMYWSILSDNGEMFANMAKYNMKDHQTEFLLTDKQYLYDEHLRYGYNSYNFYYSPSNTYYAPKFSETIFSIGDKGVFPAIGIKNLQKPPFHILDELKKEGDRFKHADFNKDNLYFIQNIYVYETNKYIAFECVKEAINSKILIYNKYSKSTCANRGSDYFMNIGVTEMRGSTGNYFFNTIAFKPDNEIHREILQSRKELANWKEDDNPVVVFWDFDM